MKKYLLFTFDCYYPNGGMNDYYDSFDTVEEARAVVKTDYYQIVDKHTLEVVEQN
jgi:hypothetical protein